jgi:uncharacterized damage-inducible protein DinB
MPAFFIPYFLILISNFGYMTETKRITELFEEIYNGDPWIGESLMGTLENISVETAAKKIGPWNSIWEIVNHIISWRENVLQRVQGSVINSPADNYFTPVSDQSEKAWQNTLQDLKNSQEKWIGFLPEMNEADLEKIYPNNNASYYNNIHGIIQHDAYHLGQIVLLAKKSP